MIYFVWTDPLPLYSGRGGTESYTVGHIRELRRRGIAAEILTYGLGKADGREFYPDITFRSLKSLKELSLLNDTIVYLNIPHAITLKKQSYVIFHYPALEQHGQRADYIKGIGSSVVITNSRFLRSYWADYLNIDEREIHVVYPFADPVFSQARRRRRSTDITQVLYAGRLSPEKGIYTLLESLHHPIDAHNPLVNQGFSFTITTAGNQTIHGQVLESFLRHHPWVKITEARHNPREMAHLFAQNDVVVMPSNHNYWHEGFGMVSVEAQHAGCRVVATNDGGLPETNCGKLILFDPGNSFALAKAIKKAGRLGALTLAERKEAIKHFSLEESVNAFLAIIKKTSRKGATRA